MKLVSEVGSLIIIRESRTKRFIRGEGQLEGEFRLSDSRSILVVLGEVRCSYCLRIVSNSSEFREDWFGGNTDVVGEIIFEEVP